MGARFFAVLACFLAWREEYHRAENASLENARLQGQGREGSTQTIQTLQEAKKRLEEQVNSQRSELLALRSSVQATSPQS